jgi:hypothetical protein
MNRDKLTKDDIGCFLLFGVVLLMLLFLTP